MRDIEFRAWDNEKHRMLSGEAIEISFGQANFGVYDLKESPNCLGDKDDFLLMQHTGLKDKKRTKEFPEGHKIFEGDIIKAKLASRHCSIMNAVFYSEEHAAFACPNGSLISLLHDLYDIEVIGNIHENPDF